MFIKLIFSCFARFTIGSIKSRLTHVKIIFLLLFIQCLCVSKFQSFPICRISSFHKNSFCFCFDQLGNCDAKPLSFKWLIAFLTDIKIKLTIILKEMFEDFSPSLAERDVEHFFSEPQFHRFKENVDFSPRFQMLLGKLNSIRVSR